MMKSAFLFRFLAVGVLLSGCGEAESTFLAWPSLAEHERAFIIEVKDGKRQPVFGPFGSEGPELRIQLLDSETIDLVVVDTRQLAALHPRVATDRWGELRIVDGPLECAECGAVCRTASNELLFHPLGPVSEVRRGAGEVFETLSENPWAAAWLQLPATWNCVDVLDEAPFERVDDWAAGLTHRNVAVIDDEHVLAITDAVRLVGARPEMLVRAPTGYYFRSAVNGPPGRAFVATVSLAGDPGSVWEFEVGTQRVVARRELSLPFHVLDVHFDERGLVVLGRDGEIATSTDTGNFDFGLIEQMPDASNITALGWSDAPFLVGAGSGGVFRGNPWQTGRPWTSERIDVNVDSTLSQFFRTEHPDGPVLWARTHERGLFYQKEGEAWQRLATEMPSRHPRCRFRTNGCGFGEPPVRTRMSAAKDGTIYATADNCPALLAFKLDQGCVSEAPLADEGGPLAESTAVGVSGDYVYVLLSDGAVRIPIASFD